MEQHRVKIKLCGLKRPIDIDFANEAQPDFIGFVINFPKSRRNVTPSQAAQLRERLRDDILPIGVFVDERPEVVAQLLNEGVIAAAQLHGKEDENYIRQLRLLTDGKLMQAFTVAKPEDVKRAQKSSADYILLDNGQGTGKAFNWSLTDGIVRPWFLAGGLTPDNITQAVKRAKPWAVDLSSGIETDGYKDREKMIAAVQAVRM